MSRLEPGGATDRPSPVVYHVGRSGDVAGGMTQVVNEYLSFPFERVAATLIKSRGDTGMLVQFAVFARAIIRILSKVRSCDSVVVVHLSQRGSFLREGLLLTLASVRRIPCMAYLHGSSFVIFCKRHPQLVKQVLARADVIVSLSDKTEEAVSSLLPSARIVRIRNAVSPGEIVDKEKLIVFGGSITRRKGVDVLLKAWQEIAPSEWHLILAGPILEPEFETVCLPNLTLAGPLPRKELLELLSRASIAVLPSRDEALPMFIIEAMARKAAVVSTHVGGISRLLNEGCGSVVEPGDARHLKCALEELMNSPQAIEEMAQRAHDRYQTEYDTDLVFPHMEQLWLELIAAKNSKLCS